MKKAFTLIELMLTIFIFVSLFSVAIITFNNLSDKTLYEEAKANLKTQLIYKKYEAAYKQTNISVDLTSFTNDLTILDATKIVFFADGTIEESYIIVSSIDGSITNKIIINVIGYISESNEISNIEPREDRLPLEYEETF